MVNVSNFCYWLLLFIISMLVEISLLTFYTVYISVLYIGSKDSKRGYKWKWHNIHLFPLHKGDMKICSPEKNHISRGQHVREIWLFRGWTNFISPLCKGNKCFIPLGQCFGEFCQIKSVCHLCLQNYYFGTYLELSVLTWPKR